MTRYAVGDVQGCFASLQDLLQKLRFSADRDQLIFVGDLVNRGPQSLQVLRFIHALGANAQLVLGNHDLHLLAQYFLPQRPAKTGDTLAQVLAAKDCAVLLHWLLQQPLLLHDATADDLIVHAGLIPEWTVAAAVQYARNAETALRGNPIEFLSRMYGDNPNRWSDAKTPVEQQRFTINVLTRLRYCTADGSINLKLKDAPAKTPPPWLPWFVHPGAWRGKTRVIFGHWSSLGFLQRPDLLALDTGCVWGGTLTAVNLDDPLAPPIQAPCSDGANSAQGD
jgi:bis(5'-nucleosyl)-tetraphosphatase (symmetrical)